MNSHHECYYYLMKWMKAETLSYLKLFYNTGTLEWMFLTHSILYGFGSSLTYMASSLVIGEYFDKDHKYHVLATSILLCGYPIGETTT